MQALDHIKGGFENTYWDELVESTREENILELLEEAKKCQEAGAYRASMVMLWSASIEKIKIMILYFSPDQLSDARHLSSESRIKSPEGLEIEDKKLIDVAEDLGLIRGNEAVTIQVIRNYIRNKCAHGKNLDLDPSDLNALQKELLESIFAKTSRAGITPQKIVELVADSKVPEDLLGAVENFTESEQFELANELYDLRKELPLTRMNRRENYLRREGHYSLFDSQSRDAVKETLEIIWPYLNQSVRSQIAEKGKRDMLESEGSIGFLIENGIAEFSVEEQEEILTEFLGGRFRYDDEDGNDVAINMALCADDLEDNISRELMEEIYAFTLTDTNYDRKEAISYFEKFISECSAANRLQLVNIVEQKIYDAEQRWKDDLDKDWVQSNFLTGEVMKFLNRYFECFGESSQTKIIESLSSSEFYRIEEIEKKVSQYRSR